MNEKLENLLKLALETPEAERRRTDNLNVGFDGEERTWELIVKYHGSLDELQSLGISVEYLIAGYAILTVPESLVELMAEYEQIEYVEMPKHFFYQQVRPADNSCIAPVVLREPFLTGEGVLIAVLDSGIDYRRADFRNVDGETKILALWDQTLIPELGDTPPGEENRPETGLQQDESRQTADETDSGEESTLGMGSEAEATDQNRRKLPPEGFRTGVEFSREQINEALLAPTVEESLRIVPSFDVSGHGTAVAGIAAGSVLSEEGYRGVAPASDLLIVKLGNNPASGFPRTTEIMRGVAYAVRKAAEWNMPLVINLSFGNSYGPHDGSSLLERFLDNASEIGRTVICVGSGNDGDTNGHFEGNVNETRSVELAVGDYETSLNMQIWKNYSDVYRFFLQSPGGIRQELPSNIENGKYTVVMEQTKLLIYFGEPAPYSVSQEIYFEFLPEDGRYINAGVWTVFIEPVRIVTGKYYLYLPGGGARSMRTGFYRSTPEMTFTIPSTAAKVITVGAMDTRFDSYAPFSGRGYAQAGRTIGVVTAGLTKPDIAAPGVNILAPDRFGGYEPFTGTSFATPIVSGSAALLMQWGITDGRDPFLYGEKVKAYLRKGARPIRGETVYPNERVGYGELCVAESL